MGSEHAAAADPEAIPDAIERREDDSAQAVEAERVPYLGFLLGGEVYGLPLQQLREVCRLTRLRRIPGAPSRVAGLVNLRGEIICALNAHAILGIARSAPVETAPDASGAAGPMPAASPRAFFVALRGFADPIGLVVDDIADIYAIDPGQIEAPPSTWSAERSAFVVGTAQVREGLMGLLDLQRLVAGA
jgi:purine-binding chemotaxis protein CheW